MKRHGFNLKTPDFIWNKNRLALEKEEMKKAMMKVIDKKPKKKNDSETKN